MRWGNGQDCWRSGGHSIEKSLAWKGHLRVRFHSFIRSFLHSNTYVSHRQNGVLLRARLTKPNKRATAKPRCPCLSLEDSLRLTYVVTVGEEKEEKKKNLLELTLKLL